ncbi:Kinesin-like protein KIN-4C [Vitis vinifera]|uniref:Kinesin-like protein KIN-4C n=1 Tax=Vitis vinifera TaxID=29760 RepID=A0A438F8M0_VITVI|nr:Kinesin-like protein KIN-4C [Vitis vinifera]
MKSIPYIIHPRYISFPDRGDQGGRRNSDRSGSTSRRQSRAADKRGSCVGPEKSEAGAFNDLGRRRLFDFWRGFERKHGAADEERRRAEFSVGGLRVPAEVKTALTENGAKRRRERVAGSEKKATAIPQSSMNLCDPSTVDRTPDEKRRKVRSRDGKRRDVKSVKKRRPQATSGRQIGEETAASSTPTLRKQECAPPWSALKTEGRRNEYKMHKLLALNQGQKMVLQRKTQEASMATKWLKELLESRKSWLHEKSSARDANGRIQAMEHEHDLSVRLQELYSEYEHQLEVRAGIAVEIVNLKEEAEMLKHKNLRCLLEEEEDDCREKDSEIRDLNKMVVELSGLVRQLEMEKAEFIHKEKSQGSQSATSLSCTVSDSDFQDMDVSEPEYSNMKAAERTPVEEHADVTGKTGSKGCCSCSKKSLCKTLKCKCRATNGSCGTSCGCAPTKCTNRDTDLFGTGASHSALLLHTALVVKPAEKNSNCAPRGKALSDIGNTLSTFPASRKHQTLKKPENSATDTDIDSMSPIYAESNAIKPDKFVTKKAGRPATRRSKKVAE